MSSMTLRTRPKFVHCLPVADLFDTIGRPERLPDWVREANEVGHLTVTLTEGLEVVLVDTPEGWRGGKRGDFVVCTTARHLWLVTPIEFEVDYEVVG